MTILASWYHANVDAVSRGEGNSAVGLAAYMTGESLKDERTGTWCTRNHPGEVLDWGTVAPPDAPAYLVSDLGKAWNAVEASETRKNSHVANHWNVASSREFSEEDHIAVAQKMAQAMTDRYGVMVTWAVHKPTEHGNEANWHIHLGHNMREVTEDGFGQKAREITAKQTRVDETIWQRKLFADTLNERLELIGSEERVSHETYKRQGIDREPKKHLGNEANQLELKGIRTELGDYNREVDARNRERLEMRLRETATDDAEIQKKADQPMSDVQERRVDDKERNELEERQLDGQVANSKTMQAIKDKLDAHTLVTDEQAKKAKAEQDERRSADDRRAAEGGIVSAHSRYAEALASTYDIRRPYASLANAAMAELGIHKREQQELKQRIAGEPDPAKRKLLETRHEIQHCDYMAITSERLATQSEIIGGRDNTPEAIRQRELAAGFSERSKHLRGIFTEGREQEQKQERQEIAKGLGALARDVNTGIPIQRPRNHTGNPQHTESRADREKREAAYGVAEADKRTDRRNDAGNGTGRTTSGPVSPHIDVKEGKDGKTTQPTFFHKPTTPPRGGGNQR